jgi:cellulose synthase/poly-beta-1,6-N-acetylglucosamine synthase-like glycosyltransferase
LNNLLLIQIITAAVTIIFSGAAFNFLISAYLQPNLDVSMLPTPNDNSSIIQIKNSGNIPALNMKLTIETYGKIFGEKIMSTENYSKINSLEENVLELFFPRFTNGEGSFLRIVMELKDIDYPDHNNTVFVTYDKGSKKVHKNLNITNSTFADSFRDFYGIIVSPGYNIYFSLISFVVAIGSAVLGLVYSRIKRKRSLRSNSPTKPEPTKDLTINEFLDKLSLLKDQGLISIDELHRIKMALSTRNQNRSLDNFIDDLKKLKDG